jgi:U4/U6.U5 tri-snRNP-associated protein 1
MGPTSDFKEKDGYKPNIKLEYIDDEGHLLSAKEAFRFVNLLVNFVFYFYTT